MSLLKKVFFIFLCFFSFSFLVEAKASVSIGTYFGAGQGSSIPEATYAYNKTNSMGYTAYLQTVPTISNLTSLANTFSNSGSNGTLFYLGHANSDTIIWNYNGSSNGNYKVGITRYGSMCTNDGYDLLSVSAWGLSNAKLAVYMGCQTAKNATNIASVAKSNGAKATLGWKKSISQADSLPWVKRFYNRLASGYTINQSITYANSYNGYTDSSSITNIAKYGKTSATMVSSKSNNDMMNDERIINVLKNENGKTLNTSNITDILNKSIKSFDYKKFVIDHVINDDNEIYYYTLKVNGLKTTIGYAVIIENNTIYVYDNMLNYEDKMKELNKITKYYENISNFDSDILISEALNNNKSIYPDVDIKLYNTIIRFNVEKMKVEYIINIKYYDKQLDVQSIISEIYEV